MTGYRSAVLIKTCSLGNISAPAPNTTHWDCHAKTHTQRESEMFWPTNSNMTQEKTEKEATDEGEKAGIRENTHCDAQEYHVCRSSLAEQRNAKTTVTLYLSVWATSGMGAHALSVRWFLMWTKERDPVRSYPGELHLDKHVQSCAHVETHTHTANLYIQLYTREQTHTHTHTYTHT